MKTRKRLGLGIILGLLLLALIAFSIGIGLRAAHQEELNTDLIQALRTGQVEETTSLLAQGAYPNARDLPDAPARSLLQQFLEAVTHPPHPEIQQARTAMSCACDSKHAAVLVKLLLDKGASVKLDDACEQPALFWAARSGDIVTVRLLLNHGAKVNNRGMVGCTALQGAVLADNPKLVRLLLDHGAQVGIGNALGEFPTSEPNSAEIQAMLKNAGKQK